MDKDTVMKIWEIQEKMREDIEYKELIAGWEQRNDRFLTVLNSLSEEQQTGVLDYLGYMIELHYKTVEYLVK